MLKSLRARVRARRYRTQRNTIEVLRFSAHGRPPRVRSSGIELFYKPRAVRSAIFVTTVSAALLWALKSYIEIFRTILV